VYQRMVLPTEVAFKFVELPWQTAEGVAVTTVGAGGGVCASDGKAQQTATATVTRALALKKVLSFEFMLCEF